MAIHPDFPSSPYEILHPDIRWFPADEALRESSYEKLLPPLVHSLRKEIHSWRERKYEGGCMNKEFADCSKEFEKPMFKKYVSLAKEIMKNN